MHNRKRCYNQYQYSPFSRTRSSSHTKSSCTHLFLIEKEGRGLTGANFSFLTDLRITALQENQCKNIQNNTNSKRLRKRDSLDWTIKKIHPLGRYTNISRIQGCPSLFIGIFIHYVIGELGRKEYIFRS